MGRQESLQSVGDHGARRVGGASVLAFCAGKPAASRRFLFRFFIPPVAGVNCRGYLISGRDDRGWVDGRRLCLEIQEESEAGFPLILLLCFRACSRGVVMRYPASIL